MGGGEMANRDDTWSEVSSGGGDWGIAGDDRDVEDKLDRDRDVEDEADRDVEDEPDRDVEDEPD
jgi:hypothetical protein